jgi:hypothetical protein
MNSHMQRGIDHGMPHDVEHTELSSEEARSLISAIFSRVRPDDPILASLSSNMAYENEDAVREWLRSLELNGEVSFIWIASREGIRIDYDLFVQYYDYLWYPSSDDVWITRNLSWVLELDHEEIFSLYRFD